jgi:hypothetical protein
MSNPIKYSTGSETLALKKGNFYIGTGDVGKGPTSSTGYYNGISPPTGGYTIYLNKETGGPSIYTVTNDTQLISLTNSIAGTSYTTANECLVYFAGQTDKMVLNRNYEGIVTDGLVLNLDAGFTPSYPRSGTTWTDLSLSGNNGTLINGPTFNSENGGSIVFDGVDDYATTTKVPNLTIESMEGNITYEYWVKPTQEIYSLFTESSNGVQYFSPGTVNGLQQNELYKYCTNNVCSPNTQPTHAAFMFALGSNGFVASAHQYGYAPPILVDYRTITGINHVVVVKRTYNCSYYLNGVKMKDSLTISRIIGDGLGNIVDNNGDITEGVNKLISDRSSYFGRFFKGNVYEYRVYLRELSATEVSQNFNAQKGRFGL